MFFPFLGRAGSPLIQRDQPGSKRSSLSAERQAQLQEARAAGSGQSRGLSSAVLDRGDLTLPPELVHPETLTRAAAYDGVSHVWFTSPYRPDGGGGLTVNDRVYSVDVQTREMRSLEVAPGAGPLASDGAGMWVGHEGSPAISIIEVASNQVAQTVELPEGGVGPRVPTAHAYDGEFMWAGTQDGALFRVPAEGDAEEIYLDLGPVLDLAFDGSHLWIATGSPAAPGPVWRLDVVELTSEQTAGRGPVLVCDGTRMWSLGVPAGADFTAESFDCSTADRIGDFTVTPAQGITGAVFDGSHVWLSLFDPAAFSDGEGGPPEELVAPAPGGGTGVRRYLVG